MKHVVCTILFAMLAIHVFSQEVDEKTARTVSGNFFDNTFSNWKGAPSTPIKNTFLRMYKNHNSTYVVNFLNGGWVILAANKSVGPVLMYSDEGEIEQNIEYPSAFNEWLSLYDEVIDSVYKNKIYFKEKQLKWKQYEENIFERQKPTSNMLKSTFYSDGFYLLDSRWGQSWANYGNFSVPAYNVMMGYGGCNNPDGNYTGNYLAGCTAVAMGQILKYWEFSYGPYTDFDWWNMPNSLNTASTNFNTERYAISTMLENIGERINANYGCDGTSALPVFSAKAAFKAVGYVEDDMDNKYKALHTYNQWVNILKDELDEHRPILYNTKHHSLVCDGYLYGTNDFHFNLGWNGDYNSWINFEDLPTEGGVLFHECLIGIHPYWRTQLVFQDNTVINQYLTGDPLSVTYQAKSVVVAKDNSTFTIMPEAYVRFLAVDSISLYPGFWAKPGSTMDAKIFANSEGTLRSYIIEEGNSDDSTETLLLSKKGGLTIYPNPSHNGIFNIEIPPTENIIHIDVTNVLGHKVFAQTTNENYFKLDLSNNPKGVYLLYINDVTYKLLYL